MTQPDDAQSELDEAISKRLGKLRAMPVDTSRLDRALEKQVPRPLRVRRWVHSHAIRGLAASLLVIATVVGVLLSVSGGPVMAAPALMAQMHEDLVSGKTPSMQVDSIAAANQALASQWPQSPAFPSVPREHVMTCCMTSVKNKKVACVLLKSDGNTAVTLTVAHASDMKAPPSPTVTQAGRVYHVQSVSGSSGSLQMIMTEREDKWICLISALPAARLIEIAAQIQF